eukprot:gene11947-biopygen1873
MPAPRSRQCPVTPGEAAEDASGTRLFHQILSCGTRPGRVRSRFSHRWEAAQHPVPGARPAGCVNRMYLLWQPRRGEMPSGRKPFWMKLYRVQQCRGSSYGPVHGQVSALGGGAYCARVFCPGPHLSARKVHIWRV